MSGKKLALMGAAALAGLLIVAAVAGAVILRSDWFREKVRQRVVETVENATGGRAGIGSFQFDWTAMRIEVRNFVLHGTEPAEKEPLFRASSITVGLKIISFARQKVDVRYVNVQDPDIHLIIDPEGHTNVPEPKIKRQSERTAMDTLINLAIGQFSVQNGIFEIESKARIPFSARGRNLDAKFTYEAAAPRYDSDISIQPLEVAWDGKTNAPVDVRIAAALEKNRIEISSARLGTGQSDLEFSGAIENLQAPRANLQFKARVVAADVNRGFGIRGLERGTAQVAGKAAWSEGSPYLITGNFHIIDGEFRQTPWQFQNVRADGALRVDPQGQYLSGLRFSGEAADARTRIPVEGHAGELTWHDSDLAARGLEVAALGGNFRGEAQLREGSRFEVRGDLDRLEARRAAGVYSREPLPWNSLVSGSLRLEGSLRQHKDLLLSANLALAPAPQSPSVRGQVSVTYDQNSGTLELGRSTLILPFSRIDLTGAIGRQLRVHLETRNINDFLPLLDENTATIPLNLEKGSAIFDGTVTGRLEEPQITGHLALTHFAYAGRSLDSLQADVNASPGNLRLQNAALERGPARAQFQMSVGLDDWKTADSGALSGDGSIRNEAVADLFMLAGEKNPGLSGSVNATGQIAGTIGDPKWSGDLEVAKGTIGDEPFDRFAAHVSGDAGALQVSSGQLTAGEERIQLALSFDHAPNRLDTGRLRFQIRSNDLQLAGIQSLARTRPGIRGTVQFTALGGLNLSAARGADEQVGITDLQADINGRGLQLTAQPLGDIHLTANSQGAVLRAHLDSTLANSSVRGDGEWKMEGDYAGSATVTFSRIDLAGLREWISPSPTHEPYPFNGFAEGEVHVNGPALKPELLQADIRIPSLEIRAASGATGLVLRNSGSIIASVAKSEIVLDKAELTGRSTDVVIGGKISLGQRNPLDLHVNGHGDLALLQTFDPEVHTSGTVSLEAAVRGSLAAPQVSGQVDLKDGAASYGMLPNGITNANGVILFTGDRATIQKLEGSTGGGKIQLSGFTGYAGNGLIFGLHADGQQVRVRYPEGVSTVADASLDFTGSTERSLLAGTITIRRASVNIQSDFGAALAKSAQPVQTPSARSGFLAGLNYDIIIQTAPDIVFESALTQDLEADANLRLRGTETNPALLGRINVTQGELVFFGTRYTINQGSVSFFNPVRVEPVLNVDLNTKARGIDITLSISGPLNKLNVTPRSDPPLQTTEIISALTTGDAPVSDFTRLGQQSPAAQPFQQSDATALLGQVIANPVSGRLQRFFGVSKLRINPTLDPALANGVQYNPQARLTVEQQVTPDVTFTYVTNLTNANPQIVSVEWSVSKQWSVVAQREENGLIGLDFYLKRRFK